MLQVSHLTRVIIRILLNLQQQQQHNQPNFFIIYLQHLRALALFCHFFNPAVSVQEHRHINLSNAVFDIKMNLAG